VGEKNMATKKIGRFIIYVFINQESVKKKIKQVLDKPHVEFVLLNGIDGDASIEYQDEFNRFKIPFQVVKDKLVLRKADFIKYMNHRSDIIPGDSFFFCSSEADFEKLAQADEGCYEIHLDDLADFSEDDFKKMGLYNELLIKGVKGYLSFGGLDYTLIERKQ